MKTYLHIDANGFVFAAVTSTSEVPAMEGCSVKVIDGEARELAGKMHDAKTKRYFEPVKAVELLEDGREVEVIQLTAGKPTADKAREFIKGAE